MNAIRIAAIVPAAGKSQRMGQPKLLLEFDGQTLIARVVTALREGGAQLVVVVTPPRDAPEGPPIARAASQAGATLITPPERPETMRDSVEVALAWLARSDPPAGIILSPGDSPGITASVVRQLLDRWTETPDAILVPLVGTRQAHPVLLPWVIALQIPLLPRDQGVNTLVKTHENRVVTLDLPHPELLAELNTPEDLRRWTEEPTRLTVQLFAIARERAGRAKVEVDLNLPATVAELRQALAAQHPALAAIVARVMIAVDSEYASDSTRIQPGAQVALIPPVSGG